MKERIPWEKRVEELKVEIYAIYLACKDHRTPWYAKAFAACVVGYAFSPLDLIPDFIPVIGYLDDFVLVPIGIALAIKMIPRAVMAECREKSQEFMGEHMLVNWIAAGIIIIIWLILAVLLIFWLKRIFKH
ncbi:MAG: YkvA family protein [Firmicutes bacterium]|nr:YkvA family protein [Bacillota bacterium]